MENNEKIERINKIYKDFRNDYDGDHFQFEWLDRDKLLSLCKAHLDKKISKEEFNELSDYLLVKMVNKLAEDYSPLEKKGKCIFKFANMDAKQLRMELEDAFAKLEDIEQYTDYASITEEEEKHLTNMYRLYLALMVIILKEFYYRKFRISDIGFLTDIAMGTDYCYKSGR